MEPEGSLPHLQLPTTCPYPEPARSSPYPHTPLPEDPSSYYPPIYTQPLLFLIAEEDSIKHFAYDVSPNTSIKNFSYIIL